MPPNPAELIQSHAMSDLLREVRQRYDVVIIDAPPLLPVTDAALLSAQADGALLVIRHGKTTRDQVKQAVSRLRQVDAAAVGAVFNMVPSGRAWEERRLRVRLRLRLRPSCADVPRCGRQAQALSSRQLGAGLYRLLPRAAIF